MEETPTDITKTDSTVQNGKSAKSSGEVDEKSTTAPDGGWGWIVVMSSFFISVIVDGICYTFGVMKSDLDEYFNESSSKTAWAGSLLSGIYLMTGPIASALMNKFNPRDVCMIGAAISGAAIFISGFSTSIEMLLITYGVIGGIGFGLMYLPAIVMVGYYFDKRRALATGIAICGSGIGTVIMAPLATYLVREYTWRGANMIFGGIVFNGIVFGALYRPLIIKETLNFIDNPDTRNSADVDERTESSAIDTQDENDTASSQHHQDDMKQLVHEHRRPTSSRLSRSRLYVSSTSLASIDDMTMNDRNKVLHGSVLSLRQTSSSKTQSSWAMSTNSQRCRHASTDSTTSMTIIRKKMPFDRKDAMYTGSLMSLDEYKDADSDMTRYASVMSSVSKTTAASTADNISTDEELSTTETKPSTFESFTTVIKEMFDFSLFKSVTFMLLCASSFIAIAGLYIPYVYVVVKLEPMGVSAVRSSLIISVLGASNTLSRVVVGFISDIKRVDSIQLHNVSVMLAGVSTCLVCVFNSWELLMFYAALFGTFIAAFITLRSIVIVELLGIERLSNASGLTFLSYGLAAMIGSPFSGALYDATGSSNVQFIVSGLMFIVAGVMIVPIRRVAQWEKDRQGGERRVKPVDAAAETVACSDLPNAECHDCVTVSSE